MPVCSPFRASLLTGQRPLTHGVFMNDVQLDTNAVTIAKVFNKQGYDTGYIGKWHLDGHGRLQNVAPGQRRQGFNSGKETNVPIITMNPFTMTTMTPPEKFGTAMIPLNRPMQP
eukprot:TRINITY_DN22502_c0_g1_i1.p3 TRINITY_DN22502_c0_g1~~TRINITY_DN22502_c0_g1_i1.p3  ORF type:complete len:114 (-),score=13.91 TRINITY_DN22502_c0_g1_i1:199-540(-)